MRKKKKLAIVTTHIIQYQVPLFKKINQIGIKADVYFASRQGLNSKFKDEGFNKKINWNINLLSGYNYIFSKKEKYHADDWKLSFYNLEQYFKTNKYDAILFFGWSNILYLKTLFLAKKYNIPTILRVETNLNKDLNVLKKFLKNIFLKILFKNIDFFLYIGSLNKKFYKHYNIEDKKLYSAPYFVDNKFFHNKLKKKKNNKINFLFVGKLIDRKDPLFFLRVAKRFKNYKNIYFNLAGSGKLESDCKNFTKQNNLTNINFLGFKNQKELRKIYSKNDFLIITSKYETWGLVINEAMASGLPVIGSRNCGATHDLVKNNTNGYVYKNFNDLTKIILKIIKTKNINKLKKNALKMIDLYKVDNTILSISKILYKL